MAESVEEISKHQKLDISEQEKNMIARSLGHEVISDEDKSHILEVINRILRDRCIYIWPDDMHGSWLTVIRYERVPAYEIHFDVFSPFPEFSINNGLHDNQRKLFDDHFGKEIENPLSRARFPQFKRPKKHEDQFIYAIAIAFCLAMQQIEANGPMRIFPFTSGNGLHITHIKYAIVDIVRNGLVTDDPKGEIWQRIPYLF
ncbi:uncharacterized protein LOC116347006 [Contarinia nasturtii]|uniref:uncharacterized protein LOC116347006 n=1 Tax=Contarinia nasturtii TaxID=265458 RepID=UPI0012D3E5FE|nr:uncharacterized protein LOC116347006 [Contarinia nasturtii]